VRAGREKGRRKARRDWIKSNNTSKKKGRDSAEELSGKRAEIGNKFLSDWI